VGSAVKLSEKSRQLLEEYIRLKAQLEEEKKRELQALLALRDLALQLLKQIDEEIQRRLARPAPTPQPAPSPRPSAPAPTPSAAPAAPSGSASGQQRRGFEALV
jgi:DNA-binding protein H-NS